MRPYTEELIYTQSEDGLALEGALIRPAEVVSRNRVFSLVYHAPEQPASLAAIACPVLAFFSATRDVGGEAELEVIRRTAGRAMRVETQVIAGGDHVYTGVENDVATLLAQWVQTLPLVP